MMVDTKNGDSYDGVLVACDTFMNMHMKDVIITSRDGKFNQCKEVFVRGNNINSIQIQPEVLEKHSVQVKLRQAEALEHRQNKRKEKDDSKNAARREEN